MIKQFDHVNVNGTSQLVTMLPHNKYTLRVMAFCAVATFLTTVLFFGAGFETYRTPESTTSLDNKRRQLSLRPRREIQLHKVEPSNVHEVASKQNDPQCVFSNITNNVCTEDIIILSHSHIKNFNLRQSIRDSWGESSSLRIHNVQVYFIVGFPIDGDSELVKGLQLEASMYGDVIVIRVPDTYEQLTQKSVCMLEWVKEHCDKTKFIMKSDDDVYVNIPKLQKSISDTSSKFQENAFMLGHIISGAQPERNRNHKYYTPYSMYRKSTYPPFLSGSAYVLPRSVVYHLLDLSSKVSSFWLEDVYITGILRESLNITLEHNDQFNIVRAERRFRQQKDNIITLHSVSTDEMIYVHSSGKPI